MNIKEWIKSSHLDSDPIPKSIVFTFIVLLILGIGMRFYRITENQFIYYDEGMYLTHNIDFLYYLKGHPVENVHQFLRYLSVLFHFALANTKALWFFLLNLRGFFLSPESWYFSRVLSAIFGSLTLPIIYLIAKRYYGSCWVGWLSVILLAI